ncbi:MAG: tRNA (adenosine(37)-N6)-dimethylallyltransferase MiaA [Mariprofundaceae bacterium]|nr:tRNA (adenosine(37)-N6)-dimethylallyltransferase MiaA [Mariprofundaceae bacterium]
MSETTMLHAIALVGATGTGKSALALRWAERTGNTIISCDSMQVYRDLDIGTAKASAADRQRVPHYLIDTVELPQICSAADWAEASRLCIQQENSAGRTPMICGGTGFYLRTLLSGIAEIPAVDEAIRQALSARLQQEGHAALHAALQAVDPVLAQQLAVADSQRVLRGLSVFEATGVPLSDWQQQKSPAPPVHCPVLVLQKPRPQLRQDIAQRFHQMMEQGWLKEARWLAGTTCADDHPAMRAVGYRQLLQHLDGACSLDEAIEQGMTATRRYAKRQETWFRHQLEAVAMGSNTTIEDYLLSHTN